MQIFDDVIKLSFAEKKVYVALGTFDGLHIGHQQVINQAIRMARAAGGVSAVFTFSNHPLSVIAPKRCPLQIVSQRDKLAILAELGVDLVMNIPFTAEFLKVSPVTFIEMLHQALQPAAIIAGPNYSFGYRGEGTPDMLQQAAQQYGFQVVIQEAVRIGHQVISSTLIRKMIGEGNVEVVARLLGRPFRLHGRVVDGDKRGRTLGFPTANLELDPTVCIPPNGVYAVQVTVGSQQYQGVANVGTNPTFAGNPKRLEVYIFDFSEMIYGQVIAVDIMHFVRKEKVFAGIEALKLQIEEDIMQTKAYFSHFTEKK